MRKNIIQHLLLSCVLCLLVPKFSNGQINGITFVKADSWANVLSLAKAQNKNIFVDAYTTWCGPCKMMDQQTYRDSLLGISVNKAYISVKIQMDRTDSDDDATKSWYKDANNLKQSAKVFAFPTLLFFSPEGELLFKSIGFKNAKALNRIAEYARSTDASVHFKNALLAYQNGEKDYKKLPDLIITTREAVGDREMALVMAKDYKTNYLDKLSLQQFLTSENIKFVSENGAADLINSKDKFFYASYHQPQLIDSILGNGAANYFVQTIVNREEVLAKLYKDTLIVAVNPDWENITKAIGNKYSKIDTGRFMLSAKEQFYRKIENWEIYSRLKSEEIRKYPRKASEMGIFDNLNHYAWDAFLHCQDKAALERALNWSDLSILLEMPDPNIQYYDTKANLLYKLGRQEEAIKLQEQAVVKNRELSDKLGRASIYPDFAINLEKMKKGLPTWPFEYKFLNVKSLLDTSVFRKWTRVAAPAISDDGKFVGYNTGLEYPYSKNSSPLTLKSIVAPSWNLELPNVRSFTFEKSKAFVLNGNNELKTITLGSQQVETIKNVNDFKIISVGTIDWLLSTNNDRELRIKNLISGEETNYSDVIEYKILYRQQALLLHTKNKNAERLSRLDLRTKVKTLICEKNEISNLCIDNKGINVAFLAEESLENQKKVAWYYVEGRPKPELLFKQENGILKDGFELESLGRFSNDGKRLFVNIISCSFPKKVSTGVQVDVWSYTDTLLQSLQLEAIKDMKAEGYMGTVRISDGVFIPISRPGDDVSIWENKNDNFAIVTRGIKGVEETWSKASRSSAFYLVDTRDGREVLLNHPPLFTELALSPSGKYILSVDHSSIYCYEVSTGITINLTKELPIPMSDETADEDPGVKPRNIFPVAWVSDEKSIVIRDKYDFWFLDISGSRMPICITNSFGRKNNISFTLTDATKFYSSSMKENETLLLYAFDNRNYKNGFFRSQLNKVSDPECLTFDNHLYGISESPAMPYDFRPLKAKQRDVWIVSRQSASESPNFFWTTDFKNFSAISDNYPEKKYNWLTAETIHFSEPNGRRQVATLYKPENFDPLKRYPIIIHYYEKKANLIHKYTPPYAMGSSINIPWFVSRGYIVCTPSINYIEGSPGDCAFNSVIGVRDYLVKQGWVDGTKIGLQGHSFGGFETNYILTHTQKFAAAMSSAGTSDLISSYNSITKGGSSKQDFGQYRMGATLWERPDLYINNSPVLFANRISTPLLLMNNKEDGAVSFSQGVEMFTALRRLGKRVWMLQYDGEAHSLSKIPNTIQHTIRVTQFFDHYLKGALPPVWMTRGIPASKKGLDDGLTLDSVMQTPGPGLVTDEEQKKIDEYSIKLLKVN